MKILTDCGKAWRNYLYANYNGKFNDIDDFITRIQLISDSQEQLLETMLEIEPNLALVTECKEEIDFQKGELADIVREFVDFYNDNFPYDEDKLIDTEILIELCHEGINCYWYEIAMDWKEWGEKAHKIWVNINDNNGYGLYYIHDTLCEMIMNEVYE